MNVLLGLITMGIVPRALGPVNYGNYSFLKNIFTQISLFLGFRTEEAFVNYNSRKDKDYQIIIWYSMFSIIMFVVLIVVLYGLKITQTLKYFFPDQEFIYILLAAFFCYWNYKASYTFVRFGDSKHLTVFVQRILVIINICATIAILLMYFLKILVLSTVFLYQIILNILLMGILYVYFKRKEYVKRLIYRKGDIDKQTFNKINTYFYNYSSPLFVYSLFTLVYVYFDRWFLQLVSGSIQQGYFNIAVRLSEIIMIFTGSMIPIYFREVASAHEKNNIESLRLTYQKYSRLFFVISAYFSVFLIFKMKFIIQLIVGESYIGAVIPVSIFLLYPIHQTLGQLNGAFLMATERTKLVRNIGIFASIIGIPITFILLSKSRIIFFHGFDLGASGIAIKMVLLQLITVSVQIIINSRYLRIGSLKLFCHQILVAMIFGFLLYILSFFETHFITDISLKNQIIVFFCEGVVYSVIIMAVVSVFPAIIGFSKTEYESIKNKMLYYLKESFHRK